MTSIWGHFRYMETQLRNSISAVIAYKLQRTPYWTDCGLAFLYPRLCHGCANADKLPHVRNFFQIPYDTRNIFLFSFIQATTDVMN